MRDSIAGLRLDHLDLVDFRNAGELHLDLPGARVFFVGPNGVGKTNLLEAISLGTAFRSFRTSTVAPLIQQAKTEAQIGLRFALGDEAQSLILQFRARRKKVEYNGDPVPRIRDLLGIFPTVVLSSHDIELLRGPPAARRTFIDLVLSAVDPIYFDALRRYHRALDERNALLRQRAPEAMIAPFDHVLAPLAATLFHKRREATARLHNALGHSYAPLTERDESPELVYAPNVEAIDPPTVLKLWQEARREDRRRQTTTRGPHRDDLRFRLQGRAARDFGSEGQQRSFVICLRMAQAIFLAAASGRRPILLADDILGELDPERRAGFWRALPEATQVIATGTQLPGDTDGWTCYRLGPGLEVSAV